MSNDEEPDASPSTEILRASTWQETSLNTAATLLPRPLSWVVHSLTTSPASRLADGSSASEW
jgi:hypothetical protein